MIIDLLLVGNKLKEYEARFIYWKVLMALPSVLLQFSISSPAVSLRSLCAAASPGYRSHHGSHF